MTDKSRQCINCRYFSRDFNKKLSLEDLETFGIGYCMYAPPKQETVEYSDDDDDFDCPLKVSVQPLVFQDSSCSKFEYNDDDVPPSKTSKTTDTDN